MRASFRRAAAVGVLGGRLGSSAARTSVWAIQWARPGKGFPDPGPTVVVPRDHKLLLPIARKAVAALSIDGAHSS